RPGPDHRSVAGRGARAGHRRPRHRPGADRGAARRRRALTGIGKGHATLPLAPAARRAHRRNPDSDDSAAAQLHRGALPDRHRHSRADPHVKAGANGIGRRKSPMLNWAVTFLVIALIAGILGLSGVAGTATQIAWILFVVFLILFIIGLVMGRRPPV